jgi:uncharacterized membrane protein
MATRTITALFDTYQTAADAVRRVEAAGVPHSEVSIVSNDPANREYTSDDAHTGTAAGASLGTVLGGGAGLLAGLGMLAIPGLGPVVAAGWLASTLVGAGVGAAAGGIVGSLTDAGISHRDAHVYAEGVSRGGTLVTVRTDDTRASQVASLLDDEGAVDLQTRESEWRASGWNGTYGDVPAVADPQIGTPVPPLTTGAPTTPAGTRARIYGDGI